MAKTRMEQEFAERSQAFIAQNTRADGCVVPAAIPVEEAAHAPSDRHVDSGRHAL